jgi:hypothetical protein
LPKSLFQKSSCVAANGNFRTHMPLFDSGSASSLTVEDKGAHRASICTI